LKVQEAAGAGTGGLFNLNISDRSFEPDILDHIGLGTAGTDVQLAVDDILKSQIGRVGDVDVVGVTLTAGTQYTIYLRGADSGDGTLQNPFLSLLDSDGTLIAQDDDSGAGANAEISFTPAATGTYFLKSEGHGGSTGTYALEVSDGQGGVDGPDYAP